MQKRLRITVHGRVQRVGYRDRVAEIARKLGLKGTVKNLEDEISVEIIVEAEESQLKDFLKRIDIKESPVEVEKIELKEEAPMGEFKYFKITRGEPYEELGERIDVAGTLLYSIDKKQDETIRALKTFNSDTTNRFDTVDTKYGRISEGLADIATSMKKFISIFEGRA